MRHYSLATDRATTEQLDRERRLVILLTLAEQLALAVGPLDGPVLVEQQIAGQIIDCCLDLLSDSQ